MLQQSVKELNQNRTFTSLETNLHAFDTVGNSILIDHLKKVCWCFRYGLCHTYLRDNSWIPREIAVCFSLLCFCGVTERSNSPYAFLFFSAQGHCKHLSILKWVICTFIFFSTGTLLTFLSQAAHSLFRMFLPGF